MSNLEVIVGKRAIVLNSRLLDRQDAWKNLDEIKNCHTAKLTIYNVMDTINSPAELHEYAKQLTALEFKLQELWGFPQDAKFHRFWETPKCSCATMDNRDSYPYRSYVSGDCKVHGYLEELEFKALGDR